METLNHYKWHIVSGLELIFIFILLIRLRKLKRSNPEEQEIRKSKSSNIDMDEMMKNIHLSNELYKKLSRVCHPDRFAGTPFTDLANEIFQEVQQSSKNYAQLLMLQDRITNELQIKV
jgi:hypothetical protein